MKSLLFLIFLLMALQPTIANANLACTHEFSSVLTKLEEVYRTTEGPFPGDIDSTRRQPGKLISAYDEPVWRRQFAVPHQSLGSVWFAEYEISLNKITCGLTHFAFNGATPPKKCLTLVQAQDKLQNYLEPQADTVPLADFPWLLEDDPTSVLTRPLVYETVNSLHLSPQSGGVYSTFTVFAQQCAAGADCWGSYQVTCDGTVVPVSDGD